MDMHAFKNFASLRLGVRFVFVVFTQRREGAKKKSLGLCRNEKQRILVFDSLKCG